MSSNLPPGVTEGMIPGNRPNDLEWERAWEWADQVVNETNLTVQEFQRAVLVGIAGVKAERDIIRALVIDVAAEARAEEKKRFRTAFKGGD